MKFLPVVLIAILAFIVGLSIKNNFVSPFNAATEEKTEASGSAQMTEAQENLPDVSGGTSPSNVKQLPNNSGTYTSKTDGDKIVINGNFKIPDFYKLNYTFILPKNGGEITGKLTDVCEGTITGTSDKPDSDGEARIQGSFSGDCKPIPGLSFKTRASGSFEGQLKLKENKVYIIYQLKEPYESRGGFEHPF